MFHAKQRETKNSRGCVLIEDSSNVSKESWCKALNDFLFLRVEHESLKEVVVGLGNDNLEIFQNLKYLYSSIL